MTQDDRVEISMLKARQHELKKFFAVVGARQADLLDQLAGRDLAKLARKPHAHRHVGEHDAVVEDLEARMRAAQDLATQKYNTQVEYARRRLERETEVIEEQFQVMSTTFFGAKF
jgi:regulator of sirC expression with transglutaminase-like and TPR domain